MQGITVDRNGKIWVSWNSVTVVTPSSLVLETEANTTSTLSTLDNSTSLFPNPTNGMVSLRIENDFQGVHNTALYNIVGKKLLTLTNNKNSQILDVSINLKDYPAGTYFIETTNSESRSIKKVEKQ